jgi:hypothetical protein
MPRQFYELEFDIDAPGRWFLREPTDLKGDPVEDAWAFVVGQPVSDPGRLRVPLSRPGRPLDFDKTTVTGTPIVSERVAAVFRHLAPHDVQLFPVEIQGESAPHFLLNVACVARCIDDSACEEVTRWAPDDGRPDRVGEYRVVSGLRIASSRVGEARVFRPWGYLLPIIVEGTLKDALEHMGITGARFVEV